MVIWKTSSFLLLSGNFSMILLKTGKDFKLKTNILNTNLNGNRNVHHLFVTQHIWKWRGRCSTWWSNTCIWQGLGGPSGSQMWLSLTPSNQTGCRHTGPWAPSSLPPVIFDKRALATNTSWILFNSVPCQVQLLLHQVENPSTKKYILTLKGTHHWPDWKGLWVLAPLISFLLSYSSD